jgi:hypothetical protein
VEREQERVLVREEEQDIYGERVLLIRFLGLLVVYLPNFHTMEEAGVYAAERACLYRPLEVSAKKR